ncbi:MAG: hypothetical protein JWO03_970 [Bacteroidetes bacterium]|nr:hypothetical protein [Bacteroidota bacterium]
MKNILIGILAMSLLMITSCKKKDTVSGGSWSFKSKSYTVTSAITNTADNAFVVISSGNNTYNQLFFSFTTLPSADGSYTVVAGAPDSTGTQVGVALTLTTGSTYVSTAYAPTTNTTANVTVANGIMKVTVPATDFANVADGTDHADLTATVNQTEK